MTGKELAEWMEENNAWDSEIIVVGEGFKYLRVKDVYEGEGENCNGAIMIMPEQDET